MSKLSFTCFKKNLFKLALTLVTSFLVGINQSSASSSEDIKFTVKGFHGSHRYYHDTSAKTPVKPLNDNRKHDLESIVKGTVKDISAIFNTQPNKKLVQEVGQENPTPPVIEIYYGPEAMDDSEVDSEIKTTDNDSKSSFVPFPKNPQAPKIVNSNASLSHEIIFEEPAKKTDDISLVQGVEQENPTPPVTEIQYDPEAMDDDSEVDTKIKTSDNDSKSFFVPLPENPQAPKIVNSNASPFDEIIVETKKPEPDDISLVQEVGQENPPSPLIEIQYGPETMDDSEVDTKIKTTDNDSKSSFVPFPKNPQAPKIVNSNASLSHEILVETKKPEPDDISLVQGVEEVNPKPSVTEYDPKAMDDSEVDAKTNDNDSESSLVPFPEDPKPRVIKYVFNDNSATPSPTNTPAPRNTKTRKEIAALIIRNPDITATIDRQIKNGEIIIVDNNTTAPKNRIPLEEVGGKNEKRDLEVGSVFEGGSGGGGDGGGGDGGGDKKVFTCPDGRKPPCLNTNEQYALAFLKDINNLPEEERTSAAKNASQIQKPEIPQGFIEAVHNEISKRLGMMLSRVGIGAGDENTLSLNSVWANTLLNFSKQGFYKNSSGYKGKMIGGSLGADIKINDATVLGIAYSNVSSNFKYLHNNSGDTIKSHNNIFSFYGQKTINNNWLLQAILSGGFSRISGKDSRKTPVGNNVTALSSFRSNSYGAETFLGYHVNTPNKIVITPNIGFRYTYYKYNAYKEKGAGAYNYAVKSQSNNLTTGIIGVKFILPYKLSEDRKVIWTLNNSMEYYFNNRPKKVKTRLAWSGDDYGEDAFFGKTPKIGYNLGTSLLHKYKNVELLVSYNYHFKAKYHSNNTTLKIKFLF